MTSEWAQALDRLAQQRQVDIVPEGWRTTAEIADASGRSECTVRRNISKMLLVHLIETKTFRIDGHKNPVPHYKLLLIVAPPE